VPATAVAATVVILVDAARDVWATQVCEVTVPVTAVGAIVVIPADAARDAWATQVCVVTVPAEVVDTVDKDLVAVST